MRASNLVNRDVAVIWNRQLDGSYTIQELAPPSGSKFGNFIQVDMEATTISGDGLTVAGKGRTTETGAGSSIFEAFRWTASGGVVPMGNYWGAPTYSEQRTTREGNEVTVTKSGFSWARDLDRTGGLAVGSSRYGIQDEATGVMTEFWGSLSSSMSFDIAGTGAVTGLGPMDTPLANSTAYAVAKDGGVIVGKFSVPVEGNVAFRKVGAAAMSPLGDLPGGSVSSLAFDVSADGRVVVGNGSIEQDASISNNTTRAFVWTENLALQNLATLAGLTSVELGPKGFLEEALAVSDDGLTIVGTYGDSGRDPGGPNGGTQQTPDRQAFRITFTEGELGLDTPAGPSAAELAANSSLAITSNGSDHTLSFEFREDLNFVYTLQYLPDLNASSTDQVEFVPDGNGGFTRNVLVAPYTGSAQFTDPILSETLTSPAAQGFWRLKVSAP